MTSDSANILILIALPLAVFIALCLLIRAFVVCPKRFRWHFVTALAWTLITGSVTAALIIIPTNDVATHLMLLVSGLIMVPSWRQLAERRREVLQDLRWATLPRRLLVHTLWGPLALFLAINGIGRYGQVQFEKALQRHDLASAFLLRDCGLGDARYLDETSDADGLSRFDRAVKRGDTTIVSDYLAIGKFGRYSKGCALSEAVEGDNAMITELLLRYGTDVNGEDDGRSEAPLYVAVSKGKVNQVRTLLRHGARADVFDHDGTKALYIAHVQKSKEIAALLMQALDRQYNRK